MNPEWEDRMELRDKPGGIPVMKQRWRELLFAHYTVYPDDVEKLLPKGVSIDTFPDAYGTEKAWIGVVPFRMEGVHPILTPSMPGLSKFAELNLRTYVHINGKYPAVYFFSLDAANALACKIARSWFHLPYHEANIKIERTTARSFRYRSERRDAGAFFDCRYTVGERRGPAEPGSLEFFLLERYLLLSQNSKNELLLGRVHHKPYVYFDAKLDDWNENLSKAAGLTKSSIVHTMYCPGINVNVFPLKSPEQVEAKLQKVRNRKAKAKA